MHKENLLLYGAVRGFLSRYLWAVKLPPQNSGGAKKLGGSPAAGKSPIGEG